MKNLTVFPIFLFVVIMSALPARAQQYQETMPDRRFIGGVVGGINLTQVDGDKLAGFNKIGFNSLLITF